MICFTKKSNRKPVKSFNFIGFACSNLTSCRFFMWNPKFDFDKSARNGRFSKFYAGLCGAENFWGLFER